MADDTWARYLREQDLNQQIRRFRSLFDFFESYTRGLIGRIDQQELRGRVMNSEESTNEVTLRLGGCSRTQLVMDAVQQVVDPAKSEPFVLYYSVESNNQLIKYLYRDRDGYYHVFNTRPFINDWINGVNGLGDITKLVELVGDISKIFLYYLVPEENYAEFDNDQTVNGVNCQTYCVAIPRPPEAY